jgi:hypothetical protein
MNIVSELDFEIVFLSANFKPITFAMYNNVDISIEIKQISGSVIAKERIAMTERQSLILKVKQTDKQ